MAMESVETKKMKSSETIIDQLTVQLERDRERERPNLAARPNTQKTGVSLS